jgi:hypothetical protein
MGLGQLEGQTEGPTLRSSLFPGVPPFIKFSRGHEESTGGPDVEGPLPWHVRRSGLVWPVVLGCVRKSGFTVCEIKVHDFEATIPYGSVWESTPITEENTHINAEVIRFQRLGKAVKINQSPGMHQLGRKDNLYMVSMNPEVIMTARTV